MTKTDSSNAQYYYANVPPRGFYNETGVMRSKSLERLEEEMDKYNNDIDGWAERCSASYGARMLTRDLDEQDEIELYQTKAALEDLMRIPEELRTWEDERIIADCKTFIERHE